MGKPVYMGLVDPNPGSDVLVNTVSPAPQFVRVVAEGLNCTPSQVHSVLNNAKNAWCRHGSPRYEARAVMLESGRVDVEVRVDMRLEYDRFVLVISQVLRDRLECWEALELLEVGQLHRLARVVGGKAASVWNRRAREHEWGLLPVVPVEVERVERFLPPFPSTVPCVAGDTH